MNAPLRIEVSWMFLVSATRRNSSRKFRLRLAPLGTRLKSTAKSDGMNFGTPARTAASRAMVCASTILLRSPDNAETTVSAPSNIRAK